MSFLQRDKPSLLHNQHSRAAGAAEADPASLPALLGGGTNASLWVSPTKTHTKASLREQGGPFGARFEGALGKLPGSRSQFSQPCEGKHHWDKASSAVSFMGMVPRGAGADGSPGELLPGGSSTSQPAALCLLYTADFSFLTVSLKLQIGSLEIGAAWSQGKATGNLSPLRCSQAGGDRHSPAGCIYRCSIL